MKVRTDLALKDNCMPYMVANNKALVDLATLRPGNLADFSKGKSVF